MAFPKTGTELVVDPTVRIEINDQAGGGKKEKKYIYEKCIIFLKEKFPQDLWRL